jgi:hypothetical protein
MNEEQAMEVLRIINSMSEAFQQTVTDEERAALLAREADQPQTVQYAAASREDAMVEFAADALRTVADDMDLVLTQRRERFYREAMEIYYTAEELSRQPEHARLIEHVEAMRRAHIAEYGYPPPPRETPHT